MFTLSLALAKYPTQNSPFAYIVTFSVSRRSSIFTFYIIFLIHRWYVYVRRFHSHKQLSKHSPASALVRWAAIRKRSGWFFNVRHWTGRHNSGTFSDCLLLLKRGMENIITNYFTPCNHSRVLLLLCLLYKTIMDTVIKNN